MTAAKEFIRACFSRYYSQHGDSISVPSLAQREFGFGTESKIDYRHKTFASERDLREFLKADAPLYASYSTGRYSLPSARPMARKGFLGADLVFDLDKTFGHEHPEKHNAIACALCLQRSREEALRFYEEFLLGDFGFAKEEVKVNYSGSKGFHFHIRTHAVQQLSSVSRKSLCDYAGGLEASGAGFFAEAGGVRGTQLRGPDAGSRGWKGKVFVHIKNFLEASGERELSEKGLSKKKVGKLLEEKRNLLNAIAKGNWDCLPDLREFWTGLADEAIRLHRIELDAPVSFDLSRLIRIPNTLHGTTGFVAKEITDLAAFHPLEHALAFGKEVQAIVCLQDASLELGGQALEFTKDKFVEAPLSAALLLALKGVAVPAPPLSF